MLRQLGPVLNVNTKPSLSAAPSLPPLTQHTCGQRPHCWDKPWVEIILSTLESLTFSMLFPLDPTLAEWVRCESHLMARHPLVLLAPAPGGQGQPALLDP